ncbi:MAG: MBL fold metallo-hydrolase [Phycisphaerae bacterium]|nr:MBL fold metallo-hydrolase [Phycisphaerae bacterium]
MPAGGRIQVTVLGSGTSHGVPMIACDCAVCTSPDPRDRRTRPSVHVAFDGHAVLIDTAPELRLQCLASGIRRCDAVLYTHHHIDHIAGLDDLRRFNWIQDSTIPCFGSADTLARLREMFRYVFDNDPEYPSHKPQLDLRQIDGPFTLFGRTITPIPLFHGPLPVLGFRMGRFAYCTDVSRIPENSWPLLVDLDVLILDALRRRPHPTHFNLEQAVAAATRIGAKRTYFTHIAHELGQAETDAALPAGMQLAYDRLVVESE